MLKIPQSWQRALRWKADHDMAPIAVLVRDAIRPHDRGDSEAHEGGGEQDRLMITHRIALDLNSRQETLFRQHAGYARVAYNWGVAETRRALDAKEARATKRFRFMPIWNAVKRDLFPWCDLHSQNPAKMALMDLHDAWERYWTTRDTPRAKFVGRPRFHKRKHGMSFRADNGPDTIRIEKRRRIRLPKIGHVRLHQEPRFDGVIRECTIKHDGRRWYACCVYDHALPTEQKAGPVVGVDMGLRHLATTYDGETFRVVENPRPLKHALQRLRRIKRGISRSVLIHGKNKRSRRRQQRYDLLRRQESRIAAIRRDHAHKATTEIAKSASVVCVESLNIQGWMASRSLARSTADAAPSQFLTLLAWKCRREGARVLVTDPWYASSKLCSACGEKNTELGRETRWRCPECGAEHDRDENAAKNLWRQGRSPTNAEIVSDPACRAVIEEAKIRQVTT